MQNSIVLKNGAIIWVTQDECDNINSELLANNNFVELPRVKKTYSASTISEIGINNIFLVPKVAGAAFKFQQQGVIALLPDGTELSYHGEQWKKALQGEYAAAMTFDELIAANTLA